MKTLLRSLPNLAPKAPEVSLLLWKRGKRRVWTLGVGVGSEGGGGGAKASPCQECGH